MPRIATTHDAFNAIAEPRRREIVDLLARRGALAVGAVVLALGLPQPAVSKHLAVLRKVGIVSAAKLGQQRVYHLEAGELRPMYEWLKTYERFWTHHVDRIKARAELRAKELASAPQNTSARKGHT